MLGKKFYPGEYKDSEYFTASSWCGNNNTTIKPVYDGETLLYFEVIEIPPLTDEQIRQELEFKAAEILDSRLLTTQRAGLANTGAFNDADLVLFGQAGYFDLWQPDTAYDQGKRLEHNGGYFEVAQAHTSAAHQPPGSAGMLAVYRPLDGSGATGDITSPIVFILGMDVINGLYYSYNDLTYLAKADMPACVWPPDTPIWQWELQ